MKKIVLLLSIILHTNYFYTSQENQTDNQLFGIENEAKEAQQKPEQEEANEKTSSIEQEMAQLKAALHQEKLEKEQLEKALLENKQLTEIDKNKTEMALKFAQKLNTDLLEAAPKDEENLHERIKQGKDNLKTIQNRIESFNESYQQRQAILVAITNQTNQQKNYFERIVAVQILSCLGAFLVGLFLTR